MEFTVKNTKECTFTTTSTFFFLCLGACWVCKCARLCVHRCVVRGMIVMYCVIYWTRHSCVYKGKQKLQKVAANVACCCCLRWGYWF